jgi:hypothetical protein
LEDPDAGPQLVVVCSGSHEKKVNLGEVLPRGAQKFAAADRRELLGTVASPDRHNSPLPPLEVVRHRSNA